MSVDDRTAQIEFRTIPWLDGYRFGEDGSAWSRVYTGEWRRLNPPRRNNGHYRFDVYPNGVRRGVALHELVCEAWHGERPPGTVCHFRDSNRDNLRPDNLYWGREHSAIRDPSVEYRDIPGYEGYQAGSDGSIWTPYRTSRKEPDGVLRRMTPTPSESGHHKVCVRKDGRQRVVSVHQLVAIAFHGASPPGMECCHNDGNPANNRVENLRWDTKVANVHDQLIHGTKARGERHGFAKFTEPEVAVIKQLHAIDPKKYGPRQLGRMFNVAHGTAGRILREEGWQHVQLRPEEIQR